MFHSSTQQTTPFSGWISTCCLCKCLCGLPSAPLWLLGFQWFSPQISCEAQGMEPVWHFPAEAGGRGGHVVSAGACLKSWACNISRVRNELLSHRANAGVFDSHPDRVWHHFVVACMVVRYNGEGWHHFPGDRDILWNDHLVIYLPSAMLHQTTFA